MKLLKNLSLSILGVGLCTAISSAPALADTTNVNVYNGTYCQPRLDSINKVEYTDKGIYIAPSAGNTTVNIVCPFNLSHNTGQQSSPLIKSASVGIIDQLSQSDVSCKLNLVAENGNIFRTIEVKSSGSNPETRKFDFPSINQRAFSVSMSCTLPKNSSGNLGIGFYTITTSP